VRVSCIIAAALIALIALILSADSLDARPESRGEGRIASHSGCVGQLVLYVMRSDGMKQRRLFRGDDPVWSPNGQENRVCRK